MNKLGFGFLRLPLKNDPGAKDYDWEIISQMVDLFMEGGGRYFDTYPTYLDGFSEEGIRRCVTERKRKNAFRQFIQTGLLQTGLCVLSSLFPRWKSA